MKVQQSFVHWIDLCYACIAALGPIETAKQEQATTSKKGGGLGQAWNSKGDEARLLADVDEKLQCLLVGGQQALTDGQRTEAIEGGTLA